MPDLSDELRSLLAPEFSRASGEVVRWVSRVPQGLQDRWAEISLSPRSTKVRITAKHEPGERASVTVHLGDQSVEHVVSDPSSRRDLEELSRFLDGMVLAFTFTMTGQLRNSVTVMIDAGVPVASIEAAVREVLAERIMES